MKKIIILFVMIFLASCGQNQSQNQNISENPEKTSSQSKLNDNDLQKISEKIKKYDNEFDEINADILALEKEYMEFQELVKEFDDSLEWLGEGYSRYEGDAGNIWKNLSDKEEEFLERYFALLFRKHSQIFSNEGVGMNRTWVVELKKDLQSGFWLEYDSGGISLHYTGSEYTVYLFTDDKIFEIAKAIIEGKRSFGGYDERGLDFEWLKNYSAKYLMDVMIEDIYINDNWIAYITPWQAFFPTGKAFSQGIWLFDTKNNTLISWDEYFVRDVINFKNNEKKYFVLYNTFDEGAIGKIVNIDRWLNREILFSLPLKKLDDSYWTNNVFQGIQEVNEFFEVKWGFSMTYTCEFGHMDEWEYVTEFKTFEEFISYEDVFKDILKEHEKDS